MNARQQRPMVLTPLVLIEIPPLNLPTLRTREHVSMTLRGGTEAPSLGRDTVTENAYCRQQPMPCFVSHVLPQEVTTAKANPVENFGAPAAEISIYPAAANARISFPRPY